jgi:hypothetical protein
MQEQSCAGEQLVLPLPTEQPNSAEHDASHAELEQGLTEAPLQVVDEMHEPHEPPLLRSW